MRLAYPGGHGGMAGQLGHVYAADGTTPLAREEMPTYRASQGEEFDDCRIWVGADPLTRRALSVSARSVRDEQGRFAGAALAYKDVTDFMQALQVKDEFVASVSHELRTPLTSIVGLRQHPARARGPAGRGALPARGRGPQQRPAAPAGRRPAAHRGGGRRADARRTHPHRRERDRPRVGPGRGPGGRGRRRSTSSSRPRTRCSWSSTGSGWRRSSTTWSRTR